MPSGYKKHACILFAVLGALLISGTNPLPAVADAIFPDKSWTDQPGPIASPDARVGGEISLFGGQYPKSLNYYLDNNVLSAEIFGALFESLLAMDPLTMAYEPGLADRWILSEDKKPLPSIFTPRHGGATGPQ